LLRQEIIGHEKIVVGSQGGTLVIGDLKGVQELFAGLGAMYIRTFIYRK
jgi:hypothetical protein